MFYLFLVLSKLHVAASFLKVATTGGFCRSVPSPTTKHAIPSNPTTSKEYTYEQLHGKTLLSVQECIDVYQHHCTKPSEQTTSRPIFIDASWYHRPDPVTQTLRNPIHEYQMGPRLPSAHYLDIDAIATTYELFPMDNPLQLPHMMPPPLLFEMAMDAYHIRKEDHVIIYARRGAVFTPRTWFLFIAMGHDENRVHLMQGSLEDWMESGGEVELHSLIGVDAVNGDAEKHNCFDDGVLNVTKLFHISQNKSTKYQVNTSRATHICDKQEVLEAVNQYLANERSPKNKPASENKMIILDTRGSGYNQKGHMPSAIHLPYRSLVNPLNPLQLLPKEKLRNLFVERGIDYLDPHTKIILSCGSGVSVCHGYLALKLLGREVSEENTRIYDGSWKEWGRLEEDLPRVLPGNVAKSDTADT
jgi:thiosulfate/3-mercaptopyruvate sulfurtransferase